MKARIALICLPAGRLASIGWNRCRKVEGSTVSVLQILIYTLPHPSAD